VNKSFINEKIVTVFYKRDLKENDKKFDKILQEKRKTNITEEDAKGLFTPMIL
jgi:hypothetical protein